MNVIDDAKNRVKSNADGIGEGSRRGIAKEVQGSISESSSEGGIEPRRAKSWVCA
jgi:hypothetical protein